MTLEVKEGDALETAKREWIKQISQRMGLKTLGGNQAMAAQASAGPGNIGSPVASAGPLQTKKVVFTKDEVGVVNEPSTKQVPLGHLKWGGKYRGDLWAIPDRNGNAVSGGDTRQLKDLG